MVDVIRIRVKDAFMAEVRAEAALINDESLGTIEGFSPAVRELIREGITARRLRRFDGLVEAAGVTPARARKRKQPEEVR